MKHRYPFYVLNISMPSSTVDINVHPNKLDVRFSNNQVVYSTIYSVITKTLESSSEVLTLDVCKTNNSKVLPSENKPNYDTHKYPEYVPKVFKDIVFRDSGIANNEQGNTIDIFAENKAYLEKLENEKKAKIEELHKQEQTKIQTTFYNLLKINIRTVLSYLSYTKYIPYI